MGWASINLALNGCKVQSIDLAPNAVNFLKDYAKYKNLNISVSEMSAEELNFQSNSFDFVLGWGFIMHTENPEISLNELIRVVKSGGKLLYIFITSIVFPTGSTSSFLEVSLWDI